MILDYFHSLRVCIIMSVGGGERGNIGALRWKKRSEKLRRARPNTLLASLAGKMAVSGRQVS